MYIILRTSTLRVTHTPSWTLWLYWALLLRLGYIIDYNRRRLATLNFWSFYSGKVIFIIIIIAFLLLYCFFCFSNLRIQNNCRLRLDLLWNALSHNLWTILDGRSMNLSWRDFWIGIEITVLDVDSWLTIILLWWIYKTHLNIIVRRYYWLVTWCEIVIEGCRYSIRFRETVRGASHSTLWNATHCIIWCNHRLAYHSSSCSRPLTIWRLLLRSKHLRNTKQRLIFFLNFHLFLCMFL